MEVLAIGATAFFGLIVLGGWVVYRLDGTTFRPDWRWIGMLVLGHVLLLVAIVTLFVAPDALPVIIGGTLGWGLILAFYVFGRSA
jgi:hypothetical protein